MLETRWEKTKRGECGLVNVMRTQWFCNLLMPLHLKLQIQLSRCKDIRKTDLTAQSGSLSS